MKKKILTLFLLFGLVGFIANPVSANTVEFYFHNVFSGGYGDILSMQMEFVNGELPYVWDVTLTPGSAMGYDSQSTFGAYLDTLTTTDGLNARGIIAAQDFDTKPFHDGLLFSAVATPDVAIDLASIQIFSAADTANPIADLIFSEKWNDLDQIITVSAIPIPGAVWLLGSGLIGLVGLGRNRNKR